MTAHLIDRFDIVDEPRSDGDGGDTTPPIAKHRGRVPAGKEAARGLEGPKSGVDVATAFPSRGEAMAACEDPDRHPVDDIRLAETTNRAAVLSAASAI